MYAYYYECVSAQGASMYEYYVYVCACICAPTYSQNRVSMYPAACVIALVSMYPGILGPELAPRWPQEDAKNTIKMRTRCRGILWAPKWPQDGSNLAQDGSQMTPR